MWTSAFHSEHVRWAISNHFGKSRFQRPCTCVRKIPNNSSWSLPSILQSMMIAQVYFESLTCTLWRWRRRAPGRRGARQSRAARRLRPHRPWLSPAQSQTSSQWDHRTHRGGRESFFGSSLSRLHPRYRGRYICLDWGRAAVVATIDGVTAGIVSWRKKSSLISRAARLIRQDAEKTAAAARSPPLEWKRWAQSSSRMRRFQHDHARLKSCLFLMRVSATMKM